MFIDCIEIIWTPSRSVNIRLHMSKPLSYCLMLGMQDPTEFHRKLVELNVIEQCINVYKTGVVQRRRLQNTKSRYDLQTHSTQNILMNY